ncbi:hypothetical protein [Effusibacillus pohliae]|uniref:hypothetical protein n=1 Tax=Effusibacillus pohliae TaxID=232270 RepID=UPI00036305F8|nr:hypothetical protein [Effusibacillus pohliae]
MEIQPPLPLPAQQLKRLAAEKANELQLNDLLRIENWASLHLASYRQHNLLRTRNPYCYL